MFKSDIRFVVSKVLFLNVINLFRRLGSDPFGLDELGPLVVMVHHWLGAHALKATSREDDGGDDVRVDVGGRTAVLDVALAVSGGGRGRDPEGGSSVARAVCELGDRGFI